MSTTEIRVVDVYPYRIDRDEVQFLLLRRAPGSRYEGSWRMVAGKIEVDETAWEAGLRELDEETGQRPLDFWVIPSVNAFYEWREDRISLAPAFAARLDVDPRLDAEHDAFAWLSPTQAGDRLEWPEQRRMVRLVHNLLRRGVPPELRVVP